MTARRERGETVLADRPPARLTAAHAARRDGRGAVRAHGTAYARAGV